MKLYLVIVALALIASPLAAASGHSGGGHGGGGGHASGGRPSGGGHTSGVRSSGRSTGSSATGRTSSGGHVRGEQPNAGTAIPRTTPRVTTSTPILAGTSPFFYGFGAYSTYRFSPFAYGSPFYGGLTWNSYGYLPGADSDAEATGSLRLHVEPRTAQVFVDGYYVGIVDDFDGHFQHLDLTPGAHRIEIRATDYAPLIFDVAIQPHHTVDYRGALTQASQ